LRYILGALGLRRVPALLRWEAARFFDLRFVCVAMPFVLLCAEFPSRKLTSSGFRFVRERCEVFGRLRAVFILRGAALRGRDRRAVLRFAGAWRLTRAAALRRLPPNPALICFALNLRRLFAMLLLPRLAGF
jgi:hypothetical protein